MNSNAETANQLLNQPVKGRDVDSLLAKLSAETSGAITEAKKADIQSFNYIRVSKRYRPYEAAPDSIDGRFAGDGFRSIVPN